MGIEPFDYTIQFRDDFFMMDGYTRINPDFVQHEIETKLGGVMKVASEWLTARPTLQALCTPEYLAALCLREANELVLSNHLRTEPVDVPSITDRLLQDGSQKRLEVGDVVFTLALLSQQLGLPHTWDSGRFSDNNLQKLNDRRQNPLEKLSLEHYLALLIYYVDRNVNTPEAELYVRFAWESLFRYIAYNAHFPRPYPAEIDDYAIAVDNQEWEIGRIIAKTVVKNTRHLPNKFFEPGETPFENPLTALACLDLFRKNHHHATDEHLLYIFNREVAQGRNAKVVTEALLLELTDYDTSAPIQERAKHFLEKGTFN